VGTVNGTTDTESTMSLMSDDHKPVHVHLLLTRKARRALRVAAAERGISMGELVALWTDREAAAMGLLAVGDPERR
jgi:hypothetical protein